MKTVFDVKNAHDPDLFVNMVLADVDHNRRARVKAVNTAIQKEQAEQYARFSLAAQWACLAVIGSFVLTVAAMLAMV